MINNNETNPKQLQLASNFNESFVNRKIFLPFFLGFRFVFYFHHKLNSKKKTRIPTKRREGRVLKWEIKSKNIIYNNNNNNMIIEWYDDERSNTSQQQEQHSE